MISCDKHDYIEIACLYQLPVKLVMKSGSNIKDLTGVAKDTTYNSDKYECVVLEVDGQRHEVVLEHVASMEAQVDNPHFQNVEF